MLCCWSKFGCAYVVGVFKTATKKNKQTRKSRSFCCTFFQRCNCCWREFLFRGASAAQEYGGLFVLRMLSPESQEGCVVSHVLLAHALVGSRRCTVGLQCLVYLVLGVCPSSINICCKLIPAEGLVC